MSHAIRDPAEVTYRRVVAIALPVVLSNATVPLQSAVDTAVIGNLGSAVYLAAVALGGASIALLLQVFNFLQFGAGALGAQALGSGAHRRVVNVLARGLILAGLISILLIAFQGPLIRGGLSLFEGSAEAERLAAVYLSIRLWAAPAELSNFALMGWFSGQSQTRRLFEMQLVISGLNIVLNLFFVLGLGMDVDGVALGTLISAYAGLGYGLWCARGRIRDICPGWVPEAARLLNREELLRLMRLNRDIFIRSMLLVGCFAYMTRLGSQQGDVVLAANGILYQLFHVASHGLDGFAIAAEALVGQAVGARHRPLLRRAVMVSTLAAFGLAACMTAVLFIVRDPLISLFTNVEAVRATAHAHFFWAAFFPVMGVLAFQMDGVFVGATESPAMRNAMIVSATVYLALGGWLAAGWGNHGVWAGIWGFLALRGLTLMVQYPRLERRVGDN